MVYAPPPLSPFHTDADRKEKCQTIFLGETMPSPSPSPPHTNAQKATHRLVTKIRAVMSFSTPTDLKQIPADRRYGPYVFSECIGEGATGRVYIARHYQTGEPRAVKVMTFSKKGEDEKAVFAEVKIGTAFGKKCRFLVNYEEVVVLNNQCIILMEYCPNGSFRAVLKEHMESGTLFEEEEITRFIYEIGSAIQTLHAEDVVHRDIKPENVFLGDKRVYKLGDYGTARTLSGNGNMTLTGTQNYMAPEIFQGETSYEKGVDVYSLGCMLHEIVALQHPFINEKGNVNVLNIIFGKTNPMKSIVITKYTSALLTLIKQMMNLDPSRRPQIAEVLSSPPIRDYIKRKEG